MDNRLNILGQLDDFRVFIKHEAKTGGDLYDGFKNYRQFVLDNWPEGMVDLQNWKQEMTRVLGHLEKKKHVKSIVRSKDLPSLKQDALQAIHHFDGLFKFHFDKKGIS